MAIGEKLRDARERMGYSVDRVADATSIDASVIDRIESELEDPTLTDIMRLAEIYIRPLEYFLDGSIPTNDVVLWRQRPNPSDAAILERQLVNLADQYELVERVCGETTKPDLPFQEVDPSTYRRSDARNLAHRVRNELGLGERPGGNLLRILEDVCTVKIFHMPIEHPGAAACSFVERYGAVILLNSNNAPRRRNFDLAHELFHLLTWKTFRPGDDHADLEEALADEFAGSLLIPEEVLRGRVDSRADDVDLLDADLLIGLAREFDVSTDAIVWRMKRLYGFAENEARDAIAKTKKPSYYSDGQESVKPGKHPRRFLDLARRAFRDGLISTGRYMEFTGVNRLEAMNIAREDADVEVEAAHS